MRLAVSPLARVSSMDYETQLASLCAFQLKGSAFVVVCTAEVGRKDQLMATERRRRPLGLGC